MRYAAFGALCRVALLLAFAAYPRPATAAPPSFHLTFTFHTGSPSHSVISGLTPGAVKAERRLRIARYGMQFADALISVIGYHAYARCLSCLAYPGGGPLGSASVSITKFNHGAPAESDPLVRPFSGSPLTLALSTVMYDVADGRLERRWSITERSAADLSEIGAHAWGISTWISELHVLNRTDALAAACGRQWQAKQYGQAFSDGCVNTFYRSAPGMGSGPAGVGLMVCAPSNFARGTVLFATATQVVVASGSPCPAFPAPGS